MIRNVDDHASDKYRAELVASRVHSCILRVVRFCALYCFCLILGSASRALVWTFLPCDPRANSEGNAARYVSFTWKCHRQLLTCAGSSFQCFLLSSLSFPLSL